MTHGWCRRLPHLATEQNEIGMWAKIQRELVLIKVEAAPENISRITQLLELFGAPVVDIGKETMTVEFSGPTNKVDALIKLMEEFNIRAVTRTGMVALKTGDEV